ncbi:unnamed protein product [Cylicocyclus nassatus]|uniref:Uncharacterized protein n=1 Tax=Cylicocyclus nassatus TaxID=53992 RepID=A0AA36MIN2_CYLNA|nr:unnamed protein product [Cylicocyclus nassatus]
MNFHQKRRKSKSSRTDRLLRNSSMRHFMIFYPATVGAVIAYFFLQRHYFFSQNPWKWFSETEAEIVKRSLARERVHLQEEICSPTTKNCFHIQDTAYSRLGELAVIRDMLLANTLYTYSSAALIQPLVLTGNNKNTSEWRVDKQKLPSTYGKVMVGFAFAMEGLKFDSIKKQEVLLLGLGGGVVANFLSTLKKTKLKMTSIELDPTVRDVAVKWFELEENDMHKTILADGAKFVREEAKKGKQYRAILLDACYSTCPVEVFLKSEVVESIAHILDGDGVLAINVLTDPARNIKKINEILKVYKIYFTSCFYFYIDLQQVLLCSHRRGWTFDEQTELFTKNLQEIDRKFGFRFT